MYHPLFRVAPDFQVDKRKIKIVRKTRASLPPFVDARKGAPKVENALTRG